MEKRPNPRISWHARIFHAAFTCDRNLPELFHELNPEIENYRELDYQVLDVEPVTDGHNANSISFIASDEAYNNKITLIIASSKWSRSFFSSLIYQTLSYIKGLSRKLYVKNPFDLDIDINLLYVGESANDAGEMNWSRTDDRSYSKEILMVPENLTFKTMSFDHEEPDENDLSSLFYQYYRFIQILEENKEKYPMSMKGFFHTIKQCQEEAIFPKYFNEKY